MAESTHAPDPTAEPIPFARDPQFWRQLGRATWVGAATGLFAVGFLGLIHLAEELIAGEDPATGWLEGELLLIPLLAFGGLLAGALRVRAGLGPDQHSVFDELAEGRVEPTDVPGTVAVSAASLLSGAPLGPEAALGSLGGGLGTWDSERRGEQPEETALATQAGVGGAFGALVSPFISGLLALELEARPQAKVPDLICTMAGAAAGFAVFFPIAGSIFLGIFELPALELRSWHLAAGIGIGFIAAALALAIAVVFGIAGRALSPQLDRRPYATPVVVGAACGAIVFALPLAGFSGAAELERVIAADGSLAVGLLLAAVAAKVVATGLALNGGFIGGALFPMLFIGGTSGVILLEIFPGLPPAVAIPALMAAIPAPLIGMPFSAVFLVAFSFGLGAEAAVPAGLAALTSLLVVRGVLRLPTAR